MIFNIKNTVDSINISFKDICSSVPSRIDIASLNEFENMLNYFLTSKHQVYCYMSFQNYKFFKNKSKNLTLQSDILNLRKGIMLSSDSFSIVVHKSIPEDVIFFAYK